MRYALEPDVPSRSAENNHRSRSPASALSHNATWKTRIERTWEEHRGTLGETSDGLIWAALNGDCKAHIKMDDRRGKPEPETPLARAKNTVDDWSRDSRGLRCRLLRQAEKIRSHLQRESIDRNGGERPSGAHASRRPCEAEEAVASWGPTHRGHGVRRGPRLEPEIGARARHGAKSHRPPCVMPTPPGRQDRDPARARAVAQIGTERLEILRRAGKLVRRRRRCLGLPSPNPRTNRARAPTPSAGESTANQRLDLCWEEGTRAPRVYVPTTEVRGR